MDVYFIAADFFRPRSRGIRLKLAEDVNSRLLEQVIVVNHEEVMPKLSLTVGRRRRRWETAYANGEDMKNRPQIFANGKDST